MTTPTYDLLASSVLTTATASVTFSSISQDYRDLVLVVQGLNTTAGSFNTRAYLNADTGSNYSHVWMTGNGSAAASVSQTNSFARLDVNGNTTDTEKNLVVAQFMDYSATDKHTTYLVRSNRASNGTDAFAGRWANTSAITSIQIFPSGNQLASGSTFHLYGIVA